VWWWWWWWWWGVLCLVSGYYNTIAVFLSDQAEVRGMGGSEVEMRDGGASSQSPEESERAESLL
jgi:hypothetical protein